MVTQVEKWDGLQSLTGRLTWVTIMGILISCWGEEMFRMIVTKCGNILRFHNCRLEGNQIVVYDRVQIYTSIKGLIKEDLVIRVKEKKL